VILSLNEIEATILKASRGAGMEWGLAEEAAQAARWLARRGLRFERSFLGILEAAPWQAEIELAAPSLRPRKAEAWLCPIRVGAYFSDLAVPSSWRIERVLRPLFLLPFAARLDASVTLVWDDLRLSAGDTESELRPVAIGAHTPDRAEIVEVTASGIRPGDTTEMRGGIEIDEAVWPRIQAFEKSTYVPASLHSRLSGAGSTAGDND
jgi:hypothetical protein